MICDTFQEMDNNWSDELIDKSEVKVCIKMKV